MSSFSTINIWLIFMFVISKNFVLTKMQVFFLDMFIISFFYSIWFLLKEHCVQNQVKLYSTQIVSDIHFYFFLQPDLWTVFLQ